MTCAGLRVIGFGFSSDFVLVLGLGLRWLGLVLGCLRWWVLSRWIGVTLIVLVSFYIAPV